MFEPFWLCDLCLMKANLDAFRDKFCGTVNRLLSASVHVKMRLCLTIPSKIAILVPQNALFALKTNGFSEQTLALNNVLKV
jgi:hypothetical protein